MKFNTKEKLQIKIAEACEELIASRAVYDEAEANLLRAKERHLKAHKTICDISDKLGKLNRLPEPEVDHSLAPKGYRAELANRDDIKGCVGCEFDCYTHHEAGRLCFASCRPDKQSVIFVKRR
jgi:hypothetical protein